MLPSNRWRVGDPADTLNNPSIASSETRTLVTLGTISNLKASKTQAGDEQQLIFLPGNVPDGIAPADPVVAIRTAARPVSFRQRQ